MNYNIKDLLKGTKAIANSTFKKKKKYHLKFNKESNNCWYIDFPNWPFEHHNLQMVGGADDLCAFLSDDNKSTYVEVIPSKKPINKPGYACLEQKESTLIGGATYLVKNLPGFERDIWICPVTLFVLGQYPKYIYLKKLKDNNK